MKGVIVAAGYGSRFLPVTRCVPKEMLPLVDRPAIDFVVQEFVEAGVTDLLIITSRRKKGLDDWFDRDVELEGALGHKPHLAAKLAPPDVRVQFVRQQEMKGTGHALLLAETFAGDDPVLVAFPDDLFGPPNISAALVKTWQETGCSVLAAAEIEGDVSRYGVIAFRDDGRVAEVVEKPAPGEQPSQIVSLGRYLYTPQIFALLRKGLEAHASGEFFPMDAIRQLASEGLVAACVVASERLDTGQPLGYLKAVVEVALAHDEVGADFEAWLRARLQT